jgi:hypothetical protein
VIKWPACPRVRREKPSAESQWRAATALRYLYPPVLVVPTQGRRATAWNPRPRTEKAIALGSIRRGQRRRFWTLERGFLRAGWHGKGAARWL